MLTISKLGLKADILPPKIAKCFAVIVILKKAINKPYFITVLL